MRNESKLRNASKIENSNGEILLSKNSYYISDKILNKDSSRSDNDSLLCLGMVDVVSSPFARCIQSA